jgi:hypothetical protein
VGTQVIRYSDPSGALEGHRGNHPRGLARVQPLQRGSHGCWDRLFDEFPEFQFVLYDDEQEVIAEGHTIPCDWDGTPEGLGSGIDAIIAAAFRA